MHRITARPDPDIRRQCRGGEQHYLRFGGSEGRVHDDFNETQYLANYADLQAAFGSDTGTATIHYIQNGFAEGRSDVLL